MSERRRARETGPAPSGLVLRVVADGRLTVAVVAGVLAVVALVVQVVGGGAAPVRASTDDVRTTVLACPRVPAAGAATDRLTVAAALGENARAKGSAMRVDELPGTDKPKLRSAGSGISRVDLGGGTAPAAVVRATGDLAPGLAAERVVEIGEGPTRSLSSLHCLTAGASAWFVGASTTGSRQSRLVLVNTERTLASVDLRLWDESGPVEVPEADEVLVQPRSTRVISLEGLAGDRKRLGIGVEVDRGQVAAALHLAEIGGRGADWLDPLMRPARRLVLPGLPAEAGDRKLFLFVPGERDAIAKVRVLGTDNEFAPAGADVVDLRAGQVRELDLDAADPGRALTVVVNSDVPVVAAVRAVAKVGGAAEQAWTAPVAALTGPTALADGRGASGEKTRLLLAAPDGAATVRVLVYLGGGAPKTRTVQIEAGRTLVLDPGGKGASRYTVVLEPMPGSGPVHAARVLTTGAGMTVTGLDTGRFSVELPAVVPDLTATTVERVRS
ncbi:MAG: DUF5719 family protein [Sporichthyaceae bacterium]